MKIRLFAAVLAAVMSMSLLVGCDNNDTTTTTTTNETTTTTETTTTVAEETTTTVDETTTAAKKTTTTKKVTTTKATTTKPTYRTMGTATTETTESVTESTSSTKRTVASRSKTTTTAFNKITPTMSIEEAAQKVTHVKGTVFAKIPKETAAVTTFNKDWAFTHHPGVAVFKGKIYAMFSQHMTGEDFPGQRLSVASSANFTDWSDPKVVIDAFDGTFVYNGVAAKVSIIPCGLYVANGKLFATGMAHDYGPVMFDSTGKFKGGGDDFVGNTTSWLSYTEDGVNWSEPVKTGALINDSLRKTTFGRWLCVSGTRFYYSDKEPDGYFWDASQMDDQQLQRTQERIKNHSPKPTNPVFTESSWYQTRDNVLFMMSRTNTGVMYLSQSYDGGDTWTESYPTNFSSSNNQFPMGELPDGRIYAIGTPYNSANQWEQWPLNIYISEDGYNFDKAYTISDEKYSLKQQGYSKGGYFGYPRVTMDDQYIYVLHSKQKEVMEIHRIKIADL